MFECLELTMPTGAIVLWVLCITVGNLFLIAAMMTLLEEPVITTPSVATGPGRWRQIFAALLAIVGGILMLIPLGSACDASLQPGIKAVVFPKQAIGIPATSSNPPLLRW